MDERIVGKAPHQITYKFVESALTEEEKNTKFYETVKSFKMQGFNLYSSSKEEFLKELNEISTFIEQLGDTFQETYTTDCELVVKYEIDRVLQIDPVTRFQQKWKEQLADKRKEEKELAEYERLKNKFGGD